MFTPALQAGKTLEQSEILQWKLPYKYKVFLWLRFTLCLGTDSTSHFLGLWDRLLLQHSFLPPNTYLSRNHFLLVSCSGHRNLFKLSLWHEGNCSNQPLCPWGIAVLLHQPATGEAFRMSLTLLFLGRTSASETEETPLKPWENSMGKQVQGGKEKFCSQRRFLNVAEEGN